MSAIVMKPGTVRTVMVNFDAFTNPIKMASRQDPGARVIAHGAPIPGGALGYFAQQWASGQTGDLRARWRTRHLRRKSGVSAGRLHKAKSHGVITKPKAS